MLDNPVKSYVKTRKDLTEYTYRLARIYHETGNIPKALDYYQQTVTRGKDEAYYYAASSSYQMGLIYENMGNYPKADNFYRLCISLKNTEYKTSLNQKAKAGLNRLRKMQPKT
jgi:tetratricopeptide (TPR) repeat protein